MAAYGGGARGAATLLEQRDTNAVHNQCGGVRGGTHDESAGPRPDMPASTQQAESDAVGRERKVATWEMRASLGKEQRPAATMAGDRGLSVDGGKGAALGTRACRTSLALLEQRGGWPSRSEH
jgi:hypothetical protein